jgi:diguanylate cyclase (GGDEF)-like protein
MSSRPAARWRPAPARVAAVALLLFCAGWLGAGLLHPWPVPVIGWLPLPVLALLAARSCRRAARLTALAAGTRRFWRQLAAACTLLAVAVTANAYDAVGSAAPSQRVGRVTLALYLAVCLVFMVALLRLPTWRRSRGAWFRFTLDAGIVVVTVGELAWYFSLRRLDVWTAQTGSALTVLAIVVVCAIATVTFVKVAFAGAGRVNRGALHLMACGAALAAAGGSLSPLLIDRPYLSSTMLAAPLACLAVQLAADRQVRDGDTPVADRAMPRRWGVLPYAAIAAADTLLLVTGADSTEARMVAVCAVALTVLVVARQISALRDNRRLLRTVDANLEQMRRYQEQLAHQVTHDTLTEIANRSLFAEQVTAHLAAGEPFHVALLDLDDFKVVNDRLGHGVGDALLKAVSRRLPERLRASDVVARLGGDEFTLLLPGSSADDVAALLLRLLRHVQEPLLLDGHEMVARVSIGVTASRPGDTPEELIRRADVAMYAAKSAGGGRWTWFDPIMDDRAAVEARLSADLRQAAARGQLSVVYQPIVELPHGRLAGVEALLRWHHPEHGAVSPAVFVPLAERTGTIVELGAWVLDQVIAQAAAWERTHGRHAPGRVTVNVSARQLQEPGFAASVAARVRGAGLDPARLVAEVTETAVLGTGSALEAVRELHDLGLQVALDDFGTGHSSLSLLVTCPVHLLKVDKSFVDGVTAHSPQAVIVDSLIGITDGLRIHAVAEGVETAAQAERLHRAGYRYAQGFHFARPMPAADIDELLHAAQHADGPAPVV